MSDQDLARTLGISPEMWAGFRRLLGQEMGCMPDEALATVQRYQELVAAAHKVPERYVDLTLEQGQELAFQILEDSLDHGSVDLKHLFTSLLAPREIGAQIVHVDGLPRFVILYEDAA